MFFFNHTNDYLTNAQAHKPKQPRRIQQSTQHYVTDTGTINLNVTTPPMTVLCSTCYSQTVKKKNSYMPRALYNGPHQQVSVLKYESVFKYTKLCFKWLKSGYCDCTMALLVECFYRIPAMILL